jgi:glucokinase
LCNEKQISTNKIDGKYIVEKYLKKEREAITAMDIHFDYLSSGVAGFINVFSPQMIVIGGGIAEAGDFYIDEIKKQVMKKAMKETRIFTKITKAKLGNQAGFFGAAALVFDKVQ